MPDSAADSRPASTRLETPETQTTPATPARRPAPAPAPAPALLFATPRAEDHGDASPAALPPTLTPATTTIQSVSLGVLSTLLGVNAASSVSPSVSAAYSTVVSPSAIPAIVTHAPSSDTHQVPADLAASTSSVPSATTTLTNTLPPTQSAALRALNAPAFQHALSNSRSNAAKSTSSRTTLSSQPVVVRTYSGSRHSPRHLSGSNSPRYNTMTRPPSEGSSALSAGLAGRADKLPSLEDFSFSAVLRAVDPEIRDAIDAIAEICAKSRMSLADEYDAHLPPQGEITSTGPGWAAGMGTLVNRGRASRIGQGWNTENTLTAVPEASSSSERLAGETKSNIAKSSKKRSQSAYGSLKSVISGGSGKGRTGQTSSKQAEASISTQAPDSTTQRPAVNMASPRHPAIAIITSPVASKQLSFDNSSAIIDVVQGSTDTPVPRPHTAVPRQARHHHRNTSLTTFTPSRQRSGTLSSLASWLPWPRPSNLDSGTQQELTKAETRLREMLTMAQRPNLGKCATSVGLA